MSSSLDETPTDSGWRFWGPRLAVAILAPVLLLVLVEGALRLFGVGFPTSVTRPCTVNGRAASCYNIFFAAPFFPPGMIKLPQMYAIPAEKPKNTIRIFVLGESAAMGDPDPAYGFSRYLEVMLRERFPTARFEVINTGIVAINSHVIVPIAREMAQHKPDFFVIYAGNNEVIGPYGPGTVLTSPAMTMPAIRTSIFVRSTRIGQLLSKVGHSKKDWGGMEMFLGNQVPADSPLMKRVYANFETNLREMISAARNSGAEVLVSTVATNLKDCAPFASVHRRGLSAEQLGAWTGLVKEGEQPEADRDYTEALKKYLAAAEIDSQYAELQFRIARCQWALGTYAAAKEHFLRARDLDSLRFRADSKENEIMRSVARSSGPGVELVDGEAELAAESHSGVIGSELLYEHVHLNPQGNYLLARAVFTQIVSKLPEDIKRAAVTTEVPSEAECGRLLALTNYDRVRVANEMLQRISRAPFTNQVNHKEAVMKLMVKTEIPSESLEQTVAEYQWAVAQDPEDKVLHGRFGALLYPYNAQAGMEQFQLARPCDDFPLISPDGMMLP